MTNGEKIKEIFPNIIKYGNILIDDTGALQKNILFDDTWWNAEYKEIPTGSTTKDGISNKSIIYKAKESKEIQEDLDKLRKLNTKNDLAVDCISRADAIKAMQDKAKKLTNEDIINGLCGAVAILYETPPITPIRPKGHWIRVTDKRGYLVWECDKCGWQQRFNTNYCPDCGSDNREVEQ